MCQHNFGELYANIFARIILELLDTEKHNFRIMGIIRI